MTTPTERLDPPGGVAMLAGRPVARIGFGAMQLPGPGVSGPPPDRDTALAVLRQAVELGVNHIANHPDAAAGTNIAAGEPSRLRDATVVLVALTMTPGRTTIVGRSSESSTPA